MILRNSTLLDTGRLHDMFRAAVAAWPRDGLRVFVRYSRGADFSGACYYRTGRITINLGRHNAYPYRVKTHVARARTEEGCWWRELYTVDAADAYELALLIFLHEFYHWLVKKARRNVRQKESRCDRFAVRALVDLHGATVRDPSGRPVPRAAWDFQDLDGFVAAARRPATRAPCPRRQPGAAAREAHRAGPPPDHGPE